MSNTLKLLDRVRERTETGSNYAVSNALRVQPQLLKRWIRGDGYPGNEAAFRIARMLGLDPADVIALIEEDKAHSEDARRFWRSVPPSGIRKALLSATALAAFVASNIAAAFTVDTATNRSMSIDTLYIMRTVATLFRRVSASLRRPSLADPVRDPSLFRLPRGASIGVVA